MCQGVAPPLREIWRRILSLSDTKGESLSGARAENQPGDYGS